MNTELLNAFNNGSKKNEQLTPQQKRAYQDNFSALLNGYRPDDKFKRELLASSGMYTTNRLEAMLFNKHNI